VVELAEQLRRLERKFSPNMVSLPRVQSPLDKTQQPANNRGADKMHSRGMNYANAYGELLRDRDPKRFVELGVFTGVSLAMWCELYPNAEVIGLDVDLDRIAKTDLVNRGAFQSNEPQVFEWDAFDPKPLSVLEDVDVFIDDGPHVTEAVVMVAEFMRDRMAPGGLFIVEDMRNGADILRQVFPHGKLFKHGMLNAVTL
jgi:predicted O-methyltransferase YrrM